MSYIHACILVGYSIKFFTDGIQAIFRLVLNCIFCVHNLVLDRIFGVHSLVLHGLSCMLDLVDNLVLYFDDFSFAVDVSLVVDLSS